MTNCAETLITRARRLWIEQGFEICNIEAMLSKITPEAREHSDAFTDEQIINQYKSNVIWLGLGEALLNYVKWENRQF